MESLKYLIKTDSDRASLALELVEKLLLNELADTDGLLLDMRDNHGEDTYYTAYLVTLFKENPVPMNGHFKITNETTSWIKKYKGE